MTRSLPGYQPYHLVSRKSRWRPPMTFIPFSCRNIICRTFTSTVETSKYIENIEAIFFGIIYIIATISEVSLVKALTYEGK